ncbi:hypothetical protein E5K00_06175 [Hymenobacter aquaticus]|uniref:Lipoprotein n=1 Tax=Hymenobacter aquaticus TaxID=1867101 RepID=A0A4Z0Q5T5_9BACT|nr:hypothetical protein [Hymenobacter aquaticus]TGE24789.1 hypothetical protein E5K00_06175 [Hymenobacter aquaticus]
MSIFTRSLFLAAVAATSLLTACADKSEDEATPADPAPTYGLGHYFHYPATNTGGGTIHAAQDITGEARLFAQVLALDFEAGPDGPHFEIDRGQLKSGWVGTYALQSPGSPSAPVFASYSYTDSGGGIRIFRFSNFSPKLTGNVTITAYDAKRQLVSGNFDVTAPGENDPTKGTLETKCDMHIFGEFTNMKVKPQQ